MTEPRVVPSIAIREDEFKIPGLKLIKNTLYQNAFYPFTLAGKKNIRIETGAVIGVWIVVGGELVYFHPNAALIRKRYFK